MTTRLCVTGAGVVSAIGIGVDATLHSLLHNESGIAPVRFLETSHKELLTGEVKMTNADMADALGDCQGIPMLRTSLMGIIAAREAIGSSGLSSEDIAKSAFISGTTVGGMDLTEKIFGDILAKGGTAANSSDIKYNDCGYSTDIIADAIGHPAFVTTVSTACSSAANAIILGANLIKAGMTDIAIVGGAEALTRFHLNGFNTLMILDHEKCRPFDRNRNGINLGEGAAFIVIENEESAQRRGVEPIAYLSGYSNTCDAFHQTATSEDGEGAYLSMTEAMKMACISPEDISYINAHGTGTPNNDATEFRAMKRIWGDKIPPFSSTKGFTGHTTSASGAIETVISLLAIRESIIPGNPGWEKELAPNARPVKTTRCGQNIEHLINNSFGFGGNDSTLIFSRYEK